VRNLSPNAKREARGIEMRNSVTTTADERAANNNGGNIKTRMDVIMA
jgi:hypothetical protein